MRQQAMYRGDVVPKDVNAAVATIKTQDAIAVAEPPVEFSIQRNEVVVEEKKPKAQMAPRRMPTAKKNGEGQHQREVLAGSRHDWLGCVYGYCPSWCVSSIQDE